MRNGAVMVCRIIKTHATTLENPTSAAKIDFVRKLFELASKDDAFRAIKEISVTVDRVTVSYIEPDVKSEDWIAFHGFVSSPSPALEKKTAGNIEPPAGD